MPRSANRPSGRKPTTRHSELAGKTGAVSTERAGHWRSYGIGIYAHSQFVTVTVVVPDYAGGTERLHRKNFYTDLESLRGALAWVRGLIPPSQSPADPAPDRPGCRAGHCRDLRRRGGRHPPVPQRQE